MLLKRKKKNKAADTPGHTPASRAVDGILWLQGRWAGYMGRISRGWTRRGKLVFLVTVCLAFGGSSLWTFLQLFNRNGTTTLSAPAPLPPTIHPGLRQIPPQRGPDARDTAIFRQFRAKLDSLQATAEGQAQLQKFLEQRPGFLDSLRHIERMLQQPPYKP